jgi:Hypoxia induced protein conserved region
MAEKIDDDLPSMYDSKEGVEALSKAGMSREEAIEALNEMQRHQQPSRASQSFLGKLKSEPLVTAGCLGTACMLAGGLYAFKAGRSGTSQRWMRARVIAQGATLVLITGALVSRAGANRQAFEERIGTRSSPPLLDSDRVQE